MLSCRREGWSRSQIARESGWEEDVGERWIPVVRAVGVLDAARDDDLLRVHARGVLEERGHEEGSILPADHRA